MKKFVAAGALMCVLALPATAAEMPACDDASMMKVDEAIKAATDAAMKDKAMKEAEMAKMAMKENKSEDCSMHLGMAMEAVMMK